MDTKSVRIPCDATIAGRMRELVDRTVFREVKLWVRRPDTEIDQVYLVEDGYSLTEFAAFLARPPLPEEEQRLTGILEAGEAVAELLQAGVAKIGVERLPAFALTGFDRSVFFLLDEIEDGTPVHVIWLPPAYVVQLVA